MIYGYIRVSTDKQTVENQRYEILKFSNSNSLHIDGWIEETISGAKNYSKRRLGQLIAQTKSGDTIICAELSRLGRSLFMIMEILSLCLDKGCKIWTIKEGYRLQDDIPSKVLAFALGLCAEIERGLICQRTKEALARLKSEGKTLGRPYGSKTNPKKCKLAPYISTIDQAIHEGQTVKQIAKSANVHPSTIRRYLKSKGISKQKTFC